MDMKKQKWIRILGRRVPLELIISYTYKVSTKYDYSTRWIVYIIFDEQMPKGEEVMEIHCKNLKDAEKIIKELDKYFEPETIRIPGATPKELDAFYNTDTGL